MLVDIQFILLPAHVPPLHHILPQDSGDALRVLDGLAGFETAFFEGSLFAELGACEVAGGAQGGLVGGEGYLCGAQEGAVGAEDGEAVCEAFGEG